MRLLFSALMLAAMTVSRGAEAAVDGLPLPGDIFPSITDIGNVRTPDNVAKDPAQHPVMMLVVFGGLTPKMKFIEALASGGYWAEYFAGRFRGGQYIQVADASDKANWDRLTGLKDFLNAQYKIHVVLQPLSYDSLSEPESVDFVLLSKKMATLMQAGRLNDFLASAYKSLKPGGTLLVEDYHAAVGKPQDASVANGYIREDYAVAQIEKTGFKLKEKNDDLLANPSDTRLQASDNSDRFLLKFSK